VTDYRSIVDADTQLVDVRQPEEVASGSLTGAVNIPLDQLPDRIGELDPNRRTVLLCRSGNRSGQAADLLVAAGFDEVINLEGGMLAYEAEQSS
jgi:rhodanese-related sulfurtransferase